MTRKLIIASAALIMLPAIAVAQERSLNNEAVCSGPGYGQDPRCVGGPSVGGWNDGAPMTQIRPIIVQTQPRRR